MEFASGRYVRVVAIIALLLGLNDASRLLGVQLGATSPIAVLGVTGFVYLSVFALALLFASVGLWIKASWGAVLLVAATSMELALYFSGHKDVQMTLFGLGVRLVLVLSILVLFVIAVRQRRARVHD
ncbi:MAG: hypothetical protein JWN11_2328 [Hyphomicrobiales bacterium]|nr:hypothetical protein [Hyphomicrobiales bacterium]